MKVFNRSSIYIGLVTLSIGLLLGWAFFGGAPDSTTNEHSHEHLETDSWTCSMHPQIRQPEPGQCPICGMDLIPVKDEPTGSTNPSEVKMSPTAMRLANIQTSVVIKKKPKREIRLNGKLKANESQVFSQSSHLAGRVEQLFVNFIGEKVSKGEVLAHIYSPDLAVAQEELFEAKKISETQPHLYQAAREKLLNMKLTERQIDDIIQAGEIQENFPVLADVSGVVLSKHISLGDYIKKGQSIFEVSDLNTIWALFDIYENDLAWIQKGDSIALEVSSWPGETFSGRIDFIDPVIDPKTRVAKARVELNNEAGKLKPEMFAVGMVYSLMDQQEQLIVPKSAVMWTGKRSIVYVKTSSTKNTGFSMREVLLGSSLGSSYIVKEGLQEGEEIATNGTFSIDAAAQLAGQPSMMNPQGETMSMMHHHGEVPHGDASDSKHSAKSDESHLEFRSRFGGVIDEYLLLKDAFVEDNLEKSKSVAKTLSQSFDAVDMTVLHEDNQSEWMSQHEAIKEALQEIATAETIQSGRQSFIRISGYFVKMIRTYGPMDKPLYIQYCPMANNNQGADWISGQMEIRNPYFGQSMLTCGEVKQKIN